MTTYVFRDPWWLLGLGLILAAIALRRRGLVTVLFVPFVSAWRGEPRLRGLPWNVLFAYAALACLVLALARPQRIEQRREVQSRGYDLMLAIDLSTSMLAEDYERGEERLNRLQAIRPIIQAFITRRPSDRIGVIVFSGRAYTLAPLTSDHAWLEKQIDRLKLGLIEDGTAIGDGLGLALTRLEQSGRSEGGRRVGAFVILLTDGASNRGALNPEQATAIARDRGIPVYTIGAGRAGLAPFPIFDALGNRIGTRQRPSDLDEETLKLMSAETGGGYFRADDAAAVENAFAAIDQAQTIEFEPRYSLITTELFRWPAFTGLLCLLAAAFTFRAPLLAPAGRRASTA